MMNDPNIIMYTILIICVFITLVKFKNISKKQDIAIETFSHLYDFTITPAIDKKKNIRADVKFFEESKNTVSANMKEIAGKIKKGYDFLHLTYPAQYDRVPLHKHFKSNELIYLLSGKIEIDIYTENKTRFFKKQKVLTTKKVLNRGDWYFIRNDRLHSIKIIKDSEFIIVAKPPIFKKAGNFNDHLKKWFSK